MTEVSSEYSGALNQCHKLVPWKKVCKMKICVQEGYWRYAFKYITCVREKAELGRKKKWTGHTVATKALASTNGSSQAEMALQSSPELR